jgi:hypothetical protein
MLPLLDNYNMSYGYNKCLCAAAQILSMCFKVDCLSMVLFVCLLKLARNPVQLANIPETL